MRDMSDWTLVFDLDGTLVETAPDLHAALNHTLASQGLGQVPLSEIRMMIGDGAKALIRKGLRWHGQPIDEKRVAEELWPTFLTHYLDNICRLSHIYDGALDSLDQLKASGATLAVCTNKAQNLAEEVIKGLNMGDYFSAILGGDAAVSKKPDGRHILDTVDLAGGSRQRVVMIGDSQTDEKAASDARLPFVFVTFGYGELAGHSVPKLSIIDHWNSMSDTLVEITSSA